MSRFFLNQASENHIGLFTPEEYTSANVFFRSLPDFKPTRLLSLSSLAAQLGLREVLVKDESSRQGLNSFKILGVSYAIHRLRAAGGVPPSATLACATDGNHGRAVARIASAMHAASRVYLPVTTTPARIRAIVAEGAEVTVVNGTYDDAVRQLARDAAKSGWLVISDTSWPGYEEIPRWIMAGYTQLLEEASQQWKDPPDVVLVQAGVGGLACAVMSWFIYRYGRLRPFLIACEPESAACLLESARAGRPVKVSGDLRTVMECLSAGEVSHLTWPVLAANINAFVSIDDYWAVEAVRLLVRHESTLVAGESGAAGLAGLLAILQSRELDPVRQAANLGPHSRVLLFLTEGASVT